MEIKAYKCEHCGKVYESEDDYFKCENIHNDKCDISYELEFSGGDEGFLEFNYDNWSSILNNENKDIFYLNIGRVGMSEEQLDNLVVKLQEIKKLYKSKRLLKIMEKI
jgi:hypothetical protein